MALTDVAKRIWNGWDLRISILISLLLQTILILCGNIRKRNAKGWVSSLLWWAYLLADSVATFTLGILSSSRSHSGTPFDPHSENGNLLAFWAPFLLLHLGGPDNITAFSLEDNELWLRHLFSLGLQVSVAIYIFWTSLSETKLLAPAILMFLAGIIKYLERSLALRFASKDVLRNSMITKPDPGPNYVKFMEEFASNKAADLPAEIIIKEERRAHTQSPEYHSVTMDESGTDEAKISGEDISNAFKFYDSFKLLVVDLILSFRERNVSCKYFLECSAIKAFKVIEVELSFVYERLYTKSIVIHSAVGPFLRCLTFTSILFALMLFSLNEKHGYLRTDVIITYVLLGGGLALESYAVCLLLFSDLAFLQMRHQKYNPIAKLSAKGNQVFRRRWKRWSDKMAQYNMMGFSLRELKRDEAGRSMKGITDVTRRIKEITVYKVLELLDWRKAWDQFWHVKYVDVSEGMKKLIFKELKIKSIAADHSKSYRHFSTCRGGWSIQKKGYSKELSWSVESDFDENILIWHIATDLLYYSTSTQNNSDSQKISKRLDNCCRLGFSSLPFLKKVKKSDNQEAGNNSSQEIDEDSNREISKRISDYMLYLLLMQPFMMPSGIGQIRYGDTCAEAKMFFERGGTVKDQKSACEKLLSVKTDVKPAKVKGDRSKSVLFDACRLAKDLKALRSAEKTWNVISVVWVEMLCYAASHCTGFYHAKQLSEGGELLTMVWILMAQFGIGEQYMIEAGHASAKLIVGK